MKAMSISSSVRVEPHTALRKESTGHLPKASPGQPKRAWDFDSLKKVDEWGKKFRKECLITQHFSVSIKVFIINFISVPTDNEGLRNALPSKTWCHEGFRIGSATLGRLPGFAVLPPSLWMSDLLSSHFPPLSELLFQGTEEGSLKEKEHLQAVT